MAKIKDAATLLATTGLALSRYIKGLRKDISTLKGQKTTPARATRLKKYEEALAAASKKVGKKPPPKTGAKGTPQDAPAAEKAVRESRERLAKTSGRPTTAAQRAKIREKLAARKNKATDEIRGVLKDTTRRLTEEGEALLNKADKPSLRKLRNDLAKGDYSRLSYSTVTGKLKSRTGKPDIKAGERRYSDRMAEEIQSRLEGEVPYTARQTAEKMGLGSKGVRPTEAELRAMGGYEIFKKGGLKKYQSRVKYGGKEYAYMGGGIVGDIPHFKPKKKPRKK